MKKVVLITLIALINTLFVNSQSWKQIGSDIDGDAAGDFSGISISLNSTGKIMAIGARSNSVNGEDSGQVRVFKNENENWVQIGAAINGEEPGDFFGQSVCLNADGTILAAGAIWNDKNGEKSGHVRVFNNQGGVWMQMGDSLLGEGEFDEFGSSVNLSADGLTLAVGAWGNNGNGNNSGHVRIFKYENNKWVQKGEDIDGEAIGDSSGIETSLSKNGEIIAIGATHNCGNGLRSGHVKVFQFQIEKWIQIGDDIDGEAKHDESGHSVSLNADGSIVAIGAIYNNGKGLNSGHTRIYKNNDGVWEQIGSDIDGEAADDYSGYSVNLNDEGTIVSIGAPGNNGTALSAGQVRIYQNQNNIWTQIGNDIDGEALGDYSGTSVSISADGSIVAVGAPWNDGNGNVSGHVRVFRNKFPIILQQPTNKIDVCANDEVSFSIFGGSISTYQWQSKQNNSNEWNNLNDINGIIDGSNTKSLTISAKKIYNKTKFRCQVTGNSGWLIDSEEAQLFLEDEKPSISCVADKVVKKNTNKYYVVNGNEFDAYDIDDNCDVSYVSNNFNWKPSLDGESLPLGETKILWFVVDTAGNLSYCSTNITVVKFLFEKTASNEELNNEKDFLIYPNPINKFLNINTAQSNVNSISIIDITGKTVYKNDNPNQTNSINLSMLYSGIYLIKIYTKSSVFTKRIIKQ